MYVYTYIHLKGLVTKKYFLNYLEKKEFIPLINDSNAFKTNPQNTVFRLPISNQSIISFLLADLNKADAY